MRAPRLASAAIVAAAVLTISTLLPCGARAFLLPSGGSSSTGKEGMPIG